MRAPAGSLCLLVGLLGLCVASCASTSGKPVLGGGTGCAIDRDCVIYGDTGPCLGSPFSPRHFCTDVSTTCKSHLSWAGTAGDQLAGTCVPPSLTDADFSTDDGGTGDLAMVDAAQVDAGASDLAGADLALSDLSIPDLATRDLPIADLAQSIDLAHSDLSMTPRDLAMTDLSMTPPPDLSRLPDLAVPPPDLAMPDLATPPDLVTLPDLNPQCGIAGCTTGTESRDGCANARTIGRTAAAASWKISSDTCSARDRFKTSGNCWSASEDHAYRLFMRAGETVSVTGTSGAGCSMSSWGATIAIYDGGGCGAQVCPSAPVICSPNNSFSLKASLVAPHDGWYVIVMSGSTAFDDNGDYTLTVKLTCAVAGCECP